MGYNLGMIGSIYPNTKLGFGKLANQGKKRGVVGSSSAPRIGGSGIYIQLTDSSRVGYGYRSTHGHGHSYHWGL